MDRKRNSTKILVLANLILIGFLIINTARSFSEQGKVSYSCKRYKNWKTFKDGAKKWKIQCDKEWIFDKKDSTADSAVFKNNKEVLVLRISNLGSQTEEVSFYELVKFLQETDIDMGKEPVSQISKFSNCSGDLGYKFISKSFLENEKPYFELNIYFMDSDRNLYQIILGAISKKKIKSNILNKMLRSFRLAE